MKYLIGILLVILTDPSEISTINKLKKKAEQEFLASNYEAAKGTYHILLDSMNVDDPAVKLNLAHAYYHLKDTSGAKTYYNGLTGATDKKLSSIALQQLGVMSKEEGKLEKSLEQLKSAIKADPLNSGARYDYEVVKKQLEEQKQQQDQDQQNQDQNQDQDGEDNQEKQDQDKEQEGEQNKGEQKEGDSEEQSEQEQKDQEQQNQEQKEGEESKEEQEKSQQEMTKEKLEEMGITEEKAKQLLEAMRQNEIKYLQYQKRKATKRPPSGKPDW
ncbi:MAG: hypothetical protein AAF789_11855 [Bacteroidota bacterium]